MDNTLYTNQAYVDHTNEVLLGRFANHLGVSLAAAIQTIDEYQANHADQHGGRKPSLGNSMAAFGVPIAQSIIWRNEGLEPERFLKPDSRLVATMERLGQALKLSVVTNNPQMVARRTLVALGLEDLLPPIVGLDSFGVSKPAPAAFAHAIELMGVPASNVGSVGDRFEIDIEPVIELGGGGILVASVDEVYTLPSLFKL